VRFAPLSLSPIGLKRLSGLLLLSAACTALALDPDNKGKDPTGTSSPADMDGDGLDATEDADDQDTAVVWKKAPEASYAVIKLGAPPVDGPPFRLCEGGQVLAHVGPLNFGEWADGRWDNNAQNRSALWNPATGTWETLPTGYTSPTRTPDELYSTRVTDVDPSGTVYGTASEEEKNPSIGMLYYGYLGRWGLSAGQMSGTTIFSTDFSGSGDAGALGPVCGRTGEYAWLDYGSDALFNTIAIQIARPQGSFSFPPKYIHSGQSVTGNQDGWFAVNSSLVTPEAASANQVLDGPGDGYMSPAGIAQIDPALVPAPPGGEGQPKPRIVVWSEGTSHIGKVTGEGAGAAVSWTTTSKKQPNGWASPDSLSGKVNARGEGIGMRTWPGETTESASLWRNGKWRKLTDHLPAGYSDLRIIDSNSNGMILANAKAPDAQNAEPVLLLPVEMTLHRRGAISAPGAALPRPAGADAIYEAVSLENADFDEQTNWVPNSDASAGETNRQDALNHANQAVDRTRDNDFVKLHLQTPIPRMQGSIELVMDQAAEGARMRADDLKFYNDQGQCVQLAQLRIADLQNPQGPLAPMLQPNGLDLFVEIADLGQLARAQADASRDQRRYADLILRLKLGGQTTEIKARIYRGGYWRNLRNGNAGTIAFYDGKGRYQDQNGAWQVDVGQLVHGPFNIQSGTGTTDETVRGRGPTPAGWYGLYERTDFRTWWDGRARPQTDHTTNRQGQPLGYLQQGSYCQWSGPGNRTAYTHQGASPPSSVRFKFELVPWGHNAHGRTVLQIHPDGFNDGTAGCVGLQAYSDCCRVFFLIRHYFGARLNVENP